jgi:hypothetical protein
MVMKKLQSKKYSKKRVSRHSGIAADWTAANMPICRYAAPRHLEKKKPSKEPKELEE